MDKERNVILITIDCLRPDFLKAFNQEMNKTITPNLDKIAKGGVIFNNAFSNGPSTPFSFPSIFTSTYPLMNPQFPKIARQFLTFPKILSENGIKTLGFNSNPYLSKSFNYNMMFDNYFDFSSQNFGIKDQILNNKIIKFTNLNIIKKILYKVSIFLWFNYWYRLTAPYKRAKEINQYVISCLKNTDSNFFTWIHYMDTHHPFLPTNKFRSKKRSEMFRTEEFIHKKIKKYSKIHQENVLSFYKDTIKYVDFEIGKLVSNLKRINKLNKTLIIITSDHGEEIGEHGGFGHTSKLYDEVLKVPLIINGPDINSGDPINELISLIDIGPTILDYFNLEMCEDFLGKSLIPLLTKDKKLRNFRDKGVFSETLIKNSRVTLSLRQGSKKISYRSLTWKIIWNFEKNQLELYELRKDPQEKNNIIKQKTKIRQELINKLIEFNTFQNKKFQQYKKRILLYDNISQQFENF
ncbi:MAG: sulfatase [Promethearchaeota archaeon]